MSKLKLVPAKSIYDAWEARVNASADAEYRRLKRRRESDPESPSVPVQTVAERPLLERLIENARESAAAAMDVARGLRLEAESRGTEGEYENLALLLRAVIAGMKNAERHAQRLTEN